MTKTKEVAIISLYNPDKWSWAEKVTKEIWEKISEEHNVSYIFPWAKSEIIKKEKIAYISIKAPKFPGINFIVFVFKLNKFLKKYKTDILIDNIWGSALYLLFNKKHFTLISIVHWCTKSLIKYAKYIKFNTLIEKIKYYGFLTLNNVFSKYVFSKSDLIITLSKYLLDELVEYYGFKKEKIRIIYNWYDPISTSSIIKKDSNSKLSVLFISNDHARKGIKLLEEIAKKLLNQNIIFYIIWGDYKSSIENVKSLGKLERKSLYELMWKSDVIFLPSYYEWQPLVILEAMSFGCIPIISKECHMDMLENTIFNEFISSNNKSEEYIQMFNTLLHKNSLDELCKQSPEVIKKYDRKNQSQQYLDIINTL